MLRRSRSWRTIRKGQTRRMPRRQSPPPQPPEPRSEALARRAREQVPNVLVAAVGLALVAIIPEWKSQLAAIAVLLGLYLLVAYGTALLSKKVRLAWAVSGWTAVVMLTAVWSLGRPPTRSGITLYLTRADVSDLASTTVEGRPSPTRGAGVVLTGQVRNVGPPSVVNFPRLLTIKLPTGEIVTGLAEIVHHHLDFTNERTGQVTSYSPSDSLVLKTSEKPVETGGQRDGILVFVVSDVKAEHLKVPGVTFTVEFSDAYGHTDTASIPWRAKQITPLEITGRLPGMAPTPAHTLPGERP